MKMAVATTPANTYVTKSHQFTTGLGSSFMTYWPEQVPPYGLSDMAYGGDIYWDWDISLGLPASLISPRAGTNCNRNPHLFQKFPIENAERRENCP